MSGFYGLTEKERDITARFVHRHVLPSGMERWIVAQHVGNGMYLAPIKRNARKKVMFDAPTSVYGSLAYIYGTAPDYNRKFDAQKGVLLYYDIEGMIRLEKNGGKPDYDNPQMVDAKQSKTEWLANRERPTDGTTEEEPDGQPATT